MVLRELDLPFHEGPRLVKSQDGVYEGAEGTGLSREVCLQISPVGYVPALSVDGVHISELSAVLFYIASLAPERGLTGRTPAETAKVVEWLSWLATAIAEHGFAGRWIPSRMVGKDASEGVLSAVQEHGNEALHEGFALIENRIQGEGHAFECHLTVVVFMLQTFWRWGKMSEADSRFHMEDYLKFKAVAKELERLQSVREALKVEGVDLQFP